MVLLLGVFRQEIEPETDHPYDSGKETEGNDRHSAYPRTGKSIEVRHCEIERADCPTDPSAYLQRLREKGFVVAKRGYVTGEEVSHALVPETGNALYQLRRGASSAVCGR